jgi:type III secretory pathway component EscR
MKISAIAAALALGMFISAPVYAETTTPKADAAAKAAKAAECSKEADAKSLHGKERKKFREECKKGK